MRVRGISFLLTLFCNLLILFGQECVSLNVSDNKGVLKNEQLVIDDCNNKCTELKAEYTQTYRTDKYKVKSIDYKNVEISEADTKVEVLGDRYSAVIKLPFKFDFFGETKDSVVIGENGVISFEPKWAGQYCPQFPEEEINAKDKGSLLTYTIFGSMQDLSFPEGNSKSGVYYRTEGVKPCRKFIVTFYEAKQFGCEQTSTFQIILEELSNKAYVYVKSKPQQCGEKGEKTVIGIRGGGRTEGIAPNSRDTGVWSASNEGWEFYPVGKELSKVTWEVGKESSEGKTLRLCKDNALPKNFIVRVNYPVGGKDYYEKQKTINISIDQKIPILKEKNLTKTFCFNETKVDLLNIAQDFIHGDINSFNITFSEKAGGKSGDKSPINDPRNHNLLGDKGIEVKFANKIDPECFQTADLNIKQARMEIASTQIILANTSNGSKDNFELSHMKNLVFKQIDSGIEVKYFNSKEEAEANQNPLRNIEMKEGENKTIWVKLSQKDVCENMPPIALKLSMKPSLKVHDIDNALQLPLMCDNGNDGRENYNLLGFMQRNALAVKNNSSDKIVGVFSSIENAKYGINALSEIDKNMIDLNRGYLYVKVESASGKVGIAKVKVRVNFSQIEIEQNYIRNVKFHDSDLDSGKSYDLNLNDIKNELIRNSQYNENDLEVEFYSDENKANSRKDEIPPTELIQKIPYEKEKNFFSKTFYVRFQLKGQDCFTVTTVRVNFYNPRVEKNEIYACASQSDQELVTFADYTSEIMGGENKAKQYEISYIFGGKEITQKTLSTNQTETIQVKVTKVVNGEKLSNIYPVKFTLSSPPKVKDVTNITIDEKQCFNTFYDEDGNAVIGAEIEFNEEFKKNIISDVSKYEFKFYHNKNTNGELSEPIPDGGFFAENKSSIIYVKVIDKITRCYSISQLKIGVNFYDKVVLQKSKGIKIESCEPDGSGGIFNYGDIKGEVFNEKAHPEWKVSYFLSRNEAIENIFPEKNTVGVKFQDPIKTVYVRVENQYGCFAIAEADLYSFYPPRLEKDKVYKICDDNLDNKVTLNIKDLRELIFADKDDEGILFHFYPSEKDLNNKTNEILAENEFSVGALSDKKIYVLSQRKGLPCYSTETISIDLKEFTELDPESISSCEIEKQGFAIFDLTKIEKTGSTYKFYRSMKDLQNDVDEITNVSAFESPNAEIYAKVRVGDNCPTLQKVKLTVNEVSRFNFDEEITFCKGGESSEIKPNITKEIEGATYEWYGPNGKVFSTDKSISGINKIGNYSLKIKNPNPNPKGCFTEVPFEIKYSPEPVIKHLLVEDNTITVQVEPSKYEVEYAIDNTENWQAENVFKDNLKGKHTIYARYKKYGCEVAKKTLVLDIYNFISPNGDGKNDIWYIDDLSVFDGQEAHLRIYDRYGNLMFEDKSKTKFKWNGKKNGQKLPSTDYYYILDLPDGRTYKGNITVKNY